MEICSKKKKGGQKHDRNSERDRETEGGRQRGEKRKLGARHKNHLATRQHNMNNKQQKINSTPITTYSKKDRAVNDPRLPPP